MSDFKDRESQYKNRRKLTIVSQKPDELIVDVYRYEGNVTEAGTSITAEVMNDFKTEITEIAQSSLPLSGGVLNGDLKFGNGTYGITNNGANYNGTSEKAVKDGLGNIISNTYAKVNLNGTTQTNAIFYAPTGSGATGQVLKSTGTGAPEWGILTKNDITDLDTYQPSVLPQATSTTLGCIKANSKTTTESEEVKIDPSTGILYSKTIPTKLSQLQNDSNLINSTQLNASIDTLENSILSMIKIENNELNFYINGTKVASINSSGELKVKTLNLVDTLS